LYLERLAWSKQWHIDRKSFTGRRMFHPYPTIRSICREHKVKSMLDYGCGKGQQYQARDIHIKDWLTIPSIVEDLGLDRVFAHDPAVPEYEAMPATGETFDLVIAVDCLEYIPDEDLADWVLPSLFAYANKAVFVTYTCLGTTKGEEPDAVTTVKEPGWILRQMEWCSRDCPVDWVIRLVAGATEPRRIYRKAANRRGWELVDLGQLTG
jgi:SAM-dependent methyltransferase